MSASVELASNPGKPADLSAPPRFTALTLELVHALVPNPYLLDTLYPLSPFLLSGWRVGVSLFSENIPSDENEFYVSFHQDGGRRKILPFEVALPAARGAALAEGRPLLVALHADNGEAAARTLSRSSVLPVVLLLSAEGANVSLLALYTAGYKGHCIVKLVQGEHEECFCFVSPIMDTAELVGALEIAGRSVARDLKIMNSIFGAKGDTVVIYLAEDYVSWSTRTIVPLDMVHDGSSVVEGDFSYCWLWSKGSNQLRILLGPVDHRYRRLRVILPNAISTTNLQHARLLLNGEVVKSEVEIWSDTSGTLSADLPTGLGAPLILGIWMPESKVADDNITRLFACIDRIELNP